LDQTLVDTLLPFFSRLVSALELVKEVTKVFAAGLPGLQIKESENDRRERRDHDLDRQH
jgi:hypothetical protein